MILLLGRHAGEGIRDPDTLWHVLAGDHLRSTWQFVGPDPFSDFTTRPWILGQWLPELVLSLTNQRFGLQGVAWLAQAGRVLVCLSLYTACRREAGPLPAAVVAALAVLGTASSLSPRPQLVGFVLLGIVVSAWLATARDLRVRWWVVAVQWVWACSHGTWVVGVLVGFVAVAGLLLDRRVTPGGATRLALVPALSLVAAAATPLGLQVFRSFTEVRAVSPYIEEWQRPPLWEPSSLALITLVLLTLAGWLAHRELVSWGSVGLVAAGAAWGLLYGRGVALGAIIIAPLAAQALHHVLRRDRPAWGREGVALGIAVLISLAVSGLAAANGPTVPTGVPNGLAPQLRALPHDAVVYNDDLLGGWLMWSFPELRHTADTRVELYGRANAVAYLSALSGGSDADEIVSRRHPAAVLVKDDSKLNRALQRNGGWRVVGDDAGYVLLLPS